MLPLQTWSPWLPNYRDGAASAQGVTMMGVMSELDVIIIHIRAEQSAEYERLLPSASCRAGASTRHEAHSSAPGSPGSRSAQTTATT